MKIAVVITLVLVLLGASVVLIGFWLPATRQGTSSRAFDAPPDLVRQTILDIDSQPSWRARVAAIERGPDGTWTEITVDGERIAFRLLVEAETSLSLEFESTRGYEGRWEAELAASSSGGSTLAVREQATTRSPMGRVLSHLFFDPDTFTMNYLDELAAEVERRARKVE